MVYSKFECLRILYLYGIVFNFLRAVVHIDSPVACMRNDDVNRAGLVVGHTSGLNSKYDVAVSNTVGRNGA